MVIKACPHTGSLLQRSEIMQKNNSNLCGMTLATLNTADLRNNEIELFVLIL